MKVSWVGLEMGMDATPKAGMIVVEAPRVATEAGVAVAD
jgi:hypothetical protein